jgi:AcrR family transcriptional regulator
MPRIEAATVREHHDLRRQRLLEAARASLLDPSLRSVGFEHIGPRAGIRRNSVYLYFPSETHLYIALAEQEVAELAKALEDVVASNEGDAAFSAIVDLVLCPEPRVEFELLRRLATRTTAQRADLAVSRSQELYTELARPLAALYEAQGAQPAGHLARLAVGILEAAASEQASVQHLEDLKAITARALAALASAAR